MADFDFATAVKKLYEGMRHSSRMTHSSVVLATTAVLDNQLESALKAAMQPQSETLYKRLFVSFGPLGSFANKIIVARALGVITDDIYGELEKIRDIRNVFAHSSKILNFESEEIAPKFGVLKKRKTAKTNPSELFADCAVVINDFLVDYLVHKSVPEK